MLFEKCPPKPADDSSEKEIESYRKWFKADEMVRCYILAFVSNVLQYQHRAMTTAYDMMLNLENLFGN